MFKYLELICELLFWKIVLEKQGKKSTEMYAGFKVPGSRYSSRRNNNNFAHFHSFFFPHHVCSKIGNDMAVRLLQNFPAFPAFRLT